MRRKDFEFLAHNIKHDKNISTYIANMTGCLLAIWCEKGYSHFDKQRFLRACDIDEETYKEVINDTDHPI